MDHDKARIRRHVASASGLGRVASAGRFCGPKGASPDVALVLFTAAAAFDPRPGASYYLKHPRPAGRRTAALGAPATRPDRLGVANRPSRESGHPEAMPLLTPSKGFGSSSRASLLRGPRVSSLFGRAGLPDLSRKRTNPINRGNTPAPEYNSSRARRQEESAGNQSAA